MKRISLALVVALVLLTSALLINRAEQQRSPTSPPMKIEISQSEPDSGNIDINFINLSKNEISVIRPLDGSLWKWHFPYYHFEILDSDGNIIHLGRSCGVSGLWANTEWPKDYLVRIPERGMKTFNLLLPHKFETSGTYTISFEYSWEPLHLDHDLPDSVWTGTVKSPTITALINQSP